MNGIAWASSHCGRARPRGQQRHQQHHPTPHRAPRPNLQRKLSLPPSGCNTAGGAPGIISGTWSGACLPPAFSLHRD